MESDVLEGLGPWLLPAAVLALAVGGGILVRAVALARIGALFARTSTDVDDLVVAGVRNHVPLWFALPGLAIAARFAPLEEGAVVLVQRGCAAVAMASVTVAAARLAGALLGRSARRNGVEIAATSLVQHVARGAIVVLGALLVLANLGVSITPLLTALGIGSLAVALALQPTLTNLIAGIHIALARPIRIGDFVELESGAKGHVDDIGWRAVRIRELSSNLVFVPNSRFADLIVTNYSMPEPEQAALVEVGVALGSDLRKVERVTREVATEVQREVEGSVPDFEPFLRFHTLGESAIRFTVILRIRGYTDRFLVSHEFIVRLRERYEREGIEIPPPQRVLRGALALERRPPPGRPLPAARVAKKSRRSPDGAVR